jgi:RimJ/RimL family protein N-acetyltransferase
VIVLHTDRLTFRMLREEDLDAYAALYADPEVARFIGGEGRPLSRAEAWRNMVLMIGHWHLRGYGMWAAVERRTQAWVGRIGFFDPEGWPGFELGWALLPRYWGRGLATEGARAALDYAFTTIGREHVISVVHPDNERSLRVAAGLGERLERTTRLQGHEVLIYGLSREAWRAAQAGVPPAPREPDAGRAGDLRGRVDRR